MRAGGSEGKGSSCKTVLGGEASVGKVLYKELHLLNWKFERAKSVIVICRKEYRFVIHRVSCRF